MSGLRKRTPTAKSKKMSKFLFCLFVKNPVYDTRRPSPPRLVANPLQPSFAFRSVAGHSGAPFFFLDCASVFRRERGKAEQYVQVGTERVVQRTVADPVGFGYPFHCRCRFVLRGAFFATNNNNSSAAVCLSVCLLGIHRLAS